MKAQGSDPDPPRAVPCGTGDQVRLQTYPRLRMGCPRQLRGHPLRVHQGLWREREEGEK